MIICATERLIGVTLGEIYLILALKLSLAFNKEQGSQSF